MGRALRGAVVFLYTDSVAGGLALVNGFFAAPPGSLAGKFELEFGDSTVPSRPRESTRARHTGAR